MEITFEDFSASFNDSEKTRYRFSKSGKKALFEYFTKDFYELYDEYDSYDPSNICEEFKEYDSKKELVKKNPYLFEESDLEGLIFDGSVIDIGNGGYILKNF